MRLVEVKLSNFRSYEQGTAITVDPLTVLIGKNDAGKSSVLDALDIFFNDATIERDDCCVRTKQTDIKIACIFDDLPAQLVIDEQYPTTLAEEFLLRADGTLEIVKAYNCAATKGKHSYTFANAAHPSAQGVDDLLNLKITELKTKAQQRHPHLASCDQASAERMNPQVLWLIIHA